MKYYTEIESKFYLPVNVQKRMNHELDNSKLPKWFYDKYQSLIDLIPKIKEMFEKLSFSEYYNSQNNKQYDKDYLEFLLQRYKTEYLRINSNLDEYLTLLEMKNSIQFWGNVLDFMFMVDGTLFEKNYFIDVMQLFNSALIDIGEIDHSLVKIYLPNQWLLTSSGYLYNMQTTAHEAGVYNNYYLEKTKWFLSKTQSGTSNVNSSFDKINLFPEFSDTSIILRCGYIKWSLLDLLLHSVDYYHFNYKVYDPNTIMTSIGMLELQQDLFDLFRRLELYADSPKDSLKKIIKITNNNYLDVLIRCCGVSKITSSPYKTIVTSLPTAKSDFREYLEKGYDVCFVPPIIINHETRAIEELNIDSPIVNSYIRNEVIYENNFSGGKVYTNYMKF